MNFLSPTPAALAANYRNANEIARAHFAGRTPTYTEAHEYANNLGFEAQQAAKANGNWSGQHQAAADARHYALVAALQLYHAAR